MIEVEGLEKVYSGGRQALRGVSFTAPPGEVVGLLGANGAGKTTLLRILAGVLFPSGGRARVGGHDVALAPERARAQIGYLPEQVPLDGDLRVGEYLRFRAELKGVRQPRQAVAKLLGEVGLAGPGDEQRLVGELSKGFRQRLGLADALLHRPPVLLLDEPTDGLDPNQRRETLDLIRRLGAEHTVLLSTHVLPEVETVCQRVVVLDEGKLVASGTPGELLAQLGAEAGPGAGQLEVSCRGEVERLRAALRETAGVVAVETLREAAELCTFALRLEPAQLEAATERVARAVLAVGELRMLRPAAQAHSTLDAVFRFLTIPNKLG